MVEGLALHITMKICPLLAAIAFIPLAYATYAAETTVIDTFDNADAASTWTATWGSNPTLEWSSDDAKGSASSGSRKSPRTTSLPRTMAGNRW